MKSILLIGMGKFGQLLGKQLLKLKNEVVIVDKNEEIINRLAGSYASAKIMNALNPESLQMMDIPSYDACVVAIGDDFQSSLEVTSLLKELRAKHVVSRATTQIQRKFLLRNGADEVIYPDLDIAEKVAITLTEHVHDYIEIDPKYSVMEIDSPTAWVGKSIAELNIRKKYNLNILAVRIGDETIGDLSPEYVFPSKVHLLVFGQTTNLLKFSRRRIR